MTTESNTSIDPTPYIQPEIIIYEDGTIHKPLPDTPEWMEVRAVIREYLNITKEQMQRRKLINELLNKTGISVNAGEWYGWSNKWYIGPDVNNERIILEVSTNANRGITQMRTMGKRISMRKPRTNPTKELNTRLKKMGL